MFAKLFQPTQLKEGSDVKVTLNIKILHGNEYTHIYEHPSRSYDSIYYELQKDYQRHTTENTFTIQLFGKVKNKSLNEVFHSFEGFLIFLQDNNLMEKDLLETRAFGYM